MNATFVNYQEQGFSPTRQQAQQALYAAQAATPKELHELYRSVIRFVHDGYEWHWILK